MCTCRDENEIIGDRVVHNKIKTSLIQIGKRGHGWLFLYKCKECGQCWEEDYPNSAMHGGGHPHLKKVDKEYITKNYSTNDATIEKEEI